MRGDDAPCRYIRSNFITGVSVGVCDFVRRFCASECMRERERERARARDTISASHVYHVSVHGAVESVAHDTGGVGVAIVISDIVPARGLLQLTGLRNGVDLNM